MALAAGVQSEVLLQLVSFASVRRVYSACLGSPILPELIPPPPLCVTQLNAAQNSHLGRVCGIFRTPKTAGSGTFDSLPALECLLNQILQLQGIPVELATTLLELPALFTDDDRLDGRWGFCADNQPPFSAEPFLPFALFSLLGDTSDAVRYRNCPERQTQAN